MSKSLIENSSRWLAAVALASMLASSGAGAQGAFNLSSLRGTYSYVNIAESVASFGLIHFDGNGKLKASIKINRPVATAGRSIATLGASGVYTVTPDGQGVATIQFEGVPEPAVYDFLITQTTAGSFPAAKAKRVPLATEVFSVNRSGGLNGQVVAPMWTRRADQ